MECLASEWVNVVMGPEERLKLAEKLLREAEELRDRCAQTGDPIACMQAGKKVWEALLQALKAIKPDLRSDDIAVFVDHELPFMSNVPEDLIDIIERAARDAHWLHEWCFYRARVKACLRHDRYERIREAIKAIEGWLRKTSH